MAEKLMLLCTKNGTRDAKTRQLKIAFIATSYLQERDGISVYLENLLAELLQQRGIPGVEIGRVDVFVGQHSLTALSTLMQKQLQQLGCAGAIDKLRFCSISDGNIVFEFLRVPGMVRRNGPYDLIVMPNLRPFLWIGKPRLSILHDLTYKVAAHHMSTLRRMYYETLVSWRLARDTFFGVISNTTKNNLLQHYPGAGRKRLVHMPNGLPFKLAWNERPAPAQLEQKLTGNHLSFVVVGRINYLKGFDRVVKACEAIDAHFAGDEISITLHVVGKETTETKLLIPDKAFKKIDVIRHGYASDDTLNALYRKSTFCFFLSRNEGFGLPLIEALWFGCIPILSGIPIFKEIMGEDFPLFDMEGDYWNAIVDFIDKLRNDRLVRQDLLEKMERVLETHRDGYKIAAEEVIKLCIRRE